MSKKNLAAYRRMARKARDRINAKVMADPRLAKMMSGEDCPFDGKRLVYGGFKSIVEL